MENKIVLLILSFGLYIIFVLIPIIPAALLYKWFPDSQVSADGVLSKFKINSSGAFAAYLVTVLLGYFVVQDIKDALLLLATRTSAEVWTVQGELQLKDRNGHEIEEKASLLKHGVGFNLKPPFLNESDGIIDLKVPGPGGGILPQILLTVNVDNFGGNTFHLSKLNDDQADIDPESHTIYLKNMFIQTVNDPDNPYPTSDTYINEQ